MTIQDYSGFSLSDFLDDDLFIRWVIEADAEGDAFWKSFLLQYPEKRETLEQASAIIRTYRMQTSFTNDQRKDQVWSQIKTSIHRQQQEARPVRSLVPLYKIAAAVALIVTFGAALWILVNDKHSITTAYGEIRTIELPDHSKVTLNGNSSLSYKRSWDPHAIREVWIEGEALFEVSHVNRDTTSIAAGDRFVVHSNGVNIEVLGTTFNVEHRRDQTQVTLLSGKVKVLAKNAAEHVVMLPGDYVEYHDTELVQKTSLQKPHFSTAWVKSEFAFVDPYLKDIVKTLQDDHGYDVEVKDEKLLALRIEGEISVATLQELLSTVEVALGLHISQSEKHIVIVRK
jgi:transmembrane sensor